MRRSSERCLETTWVSELFARLEGGDECGFFGHVADNVRWIVTGTHPLAGVYNSKRSFIEGTLERLRPLFLDTPKVKVEHLLVTEDTAVVEMTSLGTTENGKPFHNEHCWIVRFEADMIVEVRTYLDSALVSQSIHENGRSKALSASNEPLAAR